MGDTASAAIRSSATAGPPIALAANTPDANQPLPPNLFAVTVVEAELQPFDQNYRAALAEIERFSDALKTIPGAQVTILSLPVDVTSSATLTGRTTAQQQAARAHFAVKLLFEPRKG